MEVKGEKQGRRLRKARKGESTLQRARHNDYNVLELVRRPSIDRLFIWIEVQRRENYRSLHSVCFLSLPASWSHKMPQARQHLLISVAPVASYSSLASPYNCLFWAIFVYFSSSCEQPKQESSTEVPVLLAAPISKYLRQASKVATRTFPTSRTRSWVKRKVPVVPVQSESWAMSFQRTSSVSSAAHPAHSAEHLALIETNHSSNYSAKLKTNHHILPMNLSIGLH